MNSCCRMAMRWLRQKSNATLSVCSAETSVPGSGWMRPSTEYQQRQPALSTIRVSGWDLAGPEMILIHPLTQMVLTRCLRRWSYRCAYAANIRFITNGYKYQISQSADTTLSQSQTLC